VARPTHDENLPFKSTISHELKANGKLLSLPYLAMPLKWTLHFGSWH